MPRPANDSQLSFPFEYLISASDDGLRQFENLQLNHAANLDKEIAAMMKERDRARVRAEFARLLLEFRPEMMRSTGKHLERANAEWQKALPETA